MCSSDLGDALGVDVATGFLVGGPVDIVGSPDPVLTAQQRADELDDMVATTGTAFLGLTLGCVRCHAHKFDPIEHREYYSMAALLSGVKHGERPLPATPQLRDQLAGLDAAIRDLEKRLERFIAKASPVAPVAKSNGAAGKTLRPAVTAARNDDVIDPVEARFIRFTVLASSSGEPCIDELEAWSGGRNVALASADRKSTRLNSSH